MLLHIRHETLYRYDRPAKHSVQSLRLTPRTETGQRVLAWSLTAPGRQSQQIDAHGNLMHLLTLDVLHEEIYITVAGTVETEEVPDSAPADRGRLSPLVYVLDTALTHADEALLEFAASHGSQKPGRDDVMRLAQAVRDRMDYVSGATEVSDTAARAFSLGRGVCQDYAHVMIACCRALGVPARYVSGYLLTGRDDHIASHAWVDVWLAQFERWFAIDVTNGVPGGLQHCRLAVGSDYLDACPVRGVRRGGGAETMSAKVEVSGDGLPRRPATPRLRLLQQHAVQQ
ncbi:MAG: transglutaminase family protein [Gammaproteobacteria bacterium]|nr:transglutaminase family protein [Gammaproteobacteria bacterium]MBM4232584.1 transglutaminase family protein [Gammaproteobacteria bacterium]